MARQLSGQVGAVFANAGVGSMLGGTRSSASHRSLAATAAGKRKRHLEMSTSRGQRLGGQDQSGKCKAERIRSAAERRQRDNQTCQIFTQNFDSEDEWACSKCTLVNLATSASCQVCSAPKFSPMIQWMCSGCTFFNPVREKMCVICQTPHDLIDLTED